MTRTLFRKLFDSSSPLLWNPNCIIIYTSVIVITWQYLKLDKNIRYHSTNCTLVIHIFKVHVFLFEIWSWNIHKTSVVHQVINELILQNWCWPCSCLECNFAKCLLEIYFDENNLYLEFEQNVVSQWQFNTWQNHSYWKKQILLDNCQNFMNFRKLCS